MIMEEQLVGARLTKPKQRLGGTGRIYTRGYGPIPSPGMNRDSDTAVQ